MQFLNPPETASLFSLLGPDGCSFESLAAKFKATFKPEDGFRICCAALAILEDTKLLRLPQRLNAWYILHECWNEQPAPCSPFASIFAKVVGSSSYAPAERKFLLQLLKRQGLVQLGKQNGKQYLEAAAFTPLAHVDPAELAQLARLDQAPKQGQDKAGPGPGSSATTSDSSAAASTGTAAARGTTAPSLPPLPSENVYVRPTPGVLPPVPGEAKMLYPNLHADLVWDSSLGEDSGRGAAVRELLAKALKGPLLPSQQQQVLQELAADNKLVYHLGLTPKHLPTLVENTPAIAYEVLMQMMGSSGVQDYLQALATSEMSLHSMEVVNRLTLALTLPPDFLHLYIANCISSCQAAGDKYVQSRLVRLVCVFLQSLIRSKVLNVHLDLLHEIQAFCVSFSRIREATSLYRLLKQLEAGGRPGDGVGSGTSGSAVAGSGGSGSSGVSIPGRHASGEECEGAGGDACAVSPSPDMAGGSLATSLQQP